MHTDVTQPGDQSTSAPIPPPAALSRRHLLAASGLVGVVAWLQGCGGRRIARDFPQPLWPDQESQPASVTQRSTGTVWYPPPSQPSAPTQAQAPAPQAPSASAQRIIARTRWTRESPRWRMSKPMNGVGLITVHHDALNAAGMRGMAASIERLNKVRRAHLDRGPTWVDIGYHYIIDPEGRVWEGRPVNIEGAHVASTNDHNLGVMLMGNFEEHRPTQAQLNSLDGFLASQMRGYRVPLSRLYTHQELKPTECPGNNLQSYMRQTRSGRGRLARMV